MASFAASALQTPIKLLGRPSKAAGEKCARGHDHLVTAGAAEDFKIVAVLVVVGECFQENATHVRKEAPHERFDQAVCSVFVPDVTGLQAPRDRATSQISEVV